MIELKRFDGDLKDFASHMFSLHASMRTILYESKCELKRTPKLVLAIARQAKIFREYNVYNVLTSLDDISGYFCGSAEEYFKEPLINSGRSRLRPKMFRFEA